MKLFSGVFLHLMSMEECFPACYTDHELQVFQKIFKRMFVIKSGPNTCGDIRSSACKKKPGNVSHFI